MFYVHSSRMCENSRYLAAFQDFELSVFFFLIYFGHSINILSCFSHVWLFAVLCTVAHQAPLSIRFSRQKYWSGLPCPPSGDLPDPGIEPVSLVYPALPVGSFPLSHRGSSLVILADLKLWLYNCELLWAMYECYICSSSLPKMDVISYFGFRHSINSG